jgi:hypothetical protein
MKRIIFTAIISLLVLGIGSRAFAIEGVMKVQDGRVRLVVSDNGQEKSFYVWPVEKFSRCHSVGDHTFDVQLVHTSSLENGAALVNMACVLDGFAGKADDSYFLVSYKIPKKKAGYRTLNSFVYSYAAPFGPGWEGEYEETHPVTFTGSKGYATTDFIVIVSKYINRDLYGHAIRERKMVWNADVFFLKNGLMTSFVQENITGSGYADLNVDFPIVEQEEQSLVLRFGNHFKEYQWVIRTDTLGDAMYCKVTMID